VLCLTSLSLASLATSLLVASLLAPFAAHGSMLFAAFSLVDIYAGITHPGCDDINEEYESCCLNTNGIDHCGFQSICINNRTNTDFDHTAFGKCWFSADRRPVKHLVVIGFMVACLILRTQNVRSFISEKPHEERQQILLEVIPSFFVEMFGAMVFITSQTTGCIGGQYDADNLEQCYNVLSSNGTAAFFCTFCFITRCYVLLYKSEIRSVNDLLRFDLKFAEQLQVRLDEERRLERSDSSKSLTTDH